MNQHNIGSTSNMMTEINNCEGRGILQRVQAPTVENVRQQVQEEMERLRQEEERLFHEDTDPMREKLKLLLEDPEFYLFELHDVPVARTIGDLLISKNNDHGYSIEYTPNKIYSLFGPNDWSFESVDEVVDTIATLSKSIYIDARQLFNQAELESHKNMLDCIFHYLNIGRECYVCNEDAYGMQTECGHAICIYCYHKSLKNDQFTCGVCRHAESK